MKNIRNWIMNPIMVKDLRVSSRSGKLAAAIFAYELVLAVVFLFVVGIAGSSSLGHVQTYRGMAAMFPVLSAVQLVIIVVILPIMTASSISGEKERQTFDILLTTTMTPRQIIFGKMMSSVIRVMIFFVGSIPMMAVSFILGGMSWGYLFIMLLAAFIFSIFSASVGMLASTIGKKSITCIIIAYVLYFAYHQLTGIPTILIGLLSVASSSYFGISIMMLFNPVVAVVDMFVLMLQGEGIFTYANSALGTGGWLWVIGSWVVMLAVSVLFMEIAAFRIDPIKGYKSSEKGLKTVNKLQGQ